MNVLRETGPVPAMEEQANGVHHDKKPKKKNQDEESRKRKRGGVNVCFFFLIYIHHLLSLVWVQCVPAAIVVVTTDGIANEV